MFDQNLPTEQIPLFKRLQKLFFKDNTVIIKIRKEGQSLYGNKFVLGCRAGPQINITNLFHEMAHLAEREEDKLLQKPSYAWGFSFGKPWEIGNFSGFEPSTDASVRREIRVWAYQWSLQRQFGIKDSIYNTIRPIVYLPAFVYYHRSNGKNGQYHLSDQCKIKIACLEAQELSKKDFSYSNFVNAWQTRMELLKCQNQNAKVVDKNS